MKTFFINTLGCKVNQYESQQIRELLERLGLSQVEMSEKKSDFIVINTCCVTHTASAKSRQYIRKAQKLNPDAVIIACGCLPAVETGELNNPGKNVRVVKYRNELAATLGQIVNGEAVGSDSHSFSTCRDSVFGTKNAPKFNRKNKLSNRLKLGALTSFKGHTRAFLKIQDGCDGYCSYCIVPKTRPIVHSKPAEAVIREAETLVKSGHKEIVVTGVFLGAYGQKTVIRKKWAGQRNDHLAELLEKLVEIPNLARIRLSSLEPADVTERLLDAFCGHRNIMPHLHLSLQSGSDAVLKRMCRQYRPEQFVRVAELIKARLDRPAITADFIVGFPGETDADFQRTVELAREIGFAKMHVFGFSARPGTAAAAMQDTVDNRVIKNRSRILRELGEELGCKFRQQFLGEEAVVLVENSDGKVSGRSERYFMVAIKNTQERVQRRDLVRVKLVENSENGAIGEVV